MQLHSAAANDDGMTTAPPYPPSQPPLPVSLPTVDLYRPSPQPRCLSASSTSCERYQRAWIFIASMHRIVGMLDRYGHR